MKQQWRILSWSSKNWRMSPLLLWIWRCLEVILTPVLNCRWQKYTLLILMCLHFAYTAYNSPHQRRYSDFGKCGCTSLLFSGALWGTFGRKWIFEHAPFNSNLTCSVSFLLARSSGTRNKFWQSRGVWPYPTYLKHCRRSIIQLYRNNRRLRKLTEGPTNKTRGQQGPQARWWHQKEATRPRDLLLRTSYAGFDSTGCSWMPYGIRQGTTKTTRKCTIHTTLVGQGR